MSKVYLCANGTNAFKWVTSLKEATTDDEQSVRATLNQLNGATLEEVPRPAGMESKWVITSQEPEPGAGGGI